MMKGVYCRKSFILNHPAIVLYIFFQVYLICTCTDEVKKNPLVCLSSLLTYTFTSTSKLGMFVCLPFLVRLLLFMVMSTSIIFNCFYTRETTFKTSFAFSCMIKTFLNVVNPEKSKIFPSGVDPQWHRKMHPKMVKLLSFKVYHSLNRVDMGLYYLLSSAPDKKVVNFGIIIHISLLKTYFVTPHKNRLIETVLMRDHNICFP